MGRFSLGSPAERSVSLGADLEMIQPSLLPAHSPCFVTLVEDVGSQLPALTSTLPAAVPPVLMDLHPSEAVSPNKPCLWQGPWATCLVTATEKGLSQS